MTDLAGATDRGRPDTWPKDAGEFAARWNAKTLIERDEWVDVFIETQIARERLGREVEDLKSKLQASKRMHEKARVLLSKTLKERRDAQAGWSDAKATLKQIRQLLDDSKRWANDYFAEYLDEILGND